MSAVWRLRGLGLALAGAIYLVDQWIKGLMVGPLRLREVGVIDLLPFFDLRWTQNFGVSFGMLSASSPEMRWGLVALTALIATVVFVWLLRERRAIDILPLGMILGGAFGNIHDRVELGYVIDYADFHIGEFRPFMIFNVADAGISIGIVIILARALFMREKPPAAQGGAEAETN